MVTYRNLSNDVNCYIWSFSALNWYLSYPFGTPSANRCPATGDVYISQNQGVICDEGTLSIPHFHKIWCGAHLEILEGDSVVSETAVLSDLNRFNKIQKSRKMHNIKAKLSWAKVQTHRCKHSRTTRCQWVTTSKLINRCPTKDDVLLLRC